MTVYDKEGNELEAIFGKSGGSLDLGFDKSAEIVYDIDSFETAETPVVPKYSINNVQSYFRSRVQTVANRINGLSSAWQSFIVITDIHNGKLQPNHSAEIAMYLLDNTKCDKIITCGDYCNNEWIKSQYQAYMHKFIKAGFADYVYPVFGNHETIGGKTAEAKNCLYNDFLKRKDVYGVPKNVFYYFEDSTTRTRFVIINTSDANSVRVGTEQLEWIKTAVTVPDETWHVAVFGHVNLNDLGGITYANLQVPAEVVEAIKVCNGNIVGYFCGHQHIDSVYTITDAFKQIIFLNDRNEVTDYYHGYSVTNRSTGTISEQAVSAVSINTSTKQVLILRVGAGTQERTFTY